MRCDKLWIYRPGWHDFLVEKGSAGFLTSLGAQPGGPGGQGASWWSGEDRGGARQGPRGPGGRAGAGPGREFRAARGRAGGARGPAGRGGEN